MALGFNPKLIWLNTLLVCLVPPAASGALITYTVDPTQSSLTLSGTWDGQTLVSQTGNGDSLTTPLAGTISADRDIGANTIQITGASVFAENSGNYSPPGAANFGFEDMYENNFAAIVDFAFSLSGPLTTSPASFDASQLNEVVTSGQIEYLGGVPNGPPFSVQVDTVELSGSVIAPSGDATLIGAAGVETLTIPISIEATADNGLFADMDLSGNIVAVTTIPEPASMGLIAICTALLVRHHRRAYSSGRTSDQLKVDQLKDQLKVTRFN